MAITHTWYIENRVLLLNFSGQVTSEDLARLSDDITEIFESSALADIQQMHIIYNDSDVTDAPKKVQEVVKSVQFLRHRKMGWLLEYGEKSPFIKFMARIVTSITGVNYRHLDSFEHTLTHLKAADQSIDWEKVVDA